MTDLRKLTFAIVTLVFGSLVRADNGSKLRLARDLSTAERTSFGTVLMKVARALPGDCRPVEFGLYKEAPSYDRPESFAPKEGDLLTSGVFPFRLDLHMYCAQNGRRMISVTASPEHLSKTRSVKRVIEQRDAYMLYEHEYGDVVGLRIDSMAPVAEKPSPGGLAPIASVDLMFFLGSVSAGEAAARKVDVEAARKALSGGFQPPPTDESCEDASASAAPLADPKVRALEEAAVFEAVLQHSIRHDAHGQVVALESAAFELAPEARTSVLERAHCVSPETLDDFAARARASETLPKVAMVARGFEAMTEREIKERVAHKKAKADFFESLQIAFPKTNGIAQFSQVGFNATLTQAMVYVSWLRAPLWGAGDVYVLQKLSGRWRVLYFSHQWVS